MSAKGEDEVQFHDLFNPNEKRSDKELIEYRLNICNGCEWFNKKLKKCRQCGCFMNLKTTLRRASCPIGKW